MWLLLLYHANSITMQLYCPFDNTNKILTTLRIGGKNYNNSNIDVPKQRSLLHRAVLPGVSEGGRIPRSSGCAGLCSGSLYYTVLTLLNTLYEGDSLTDILFPSSPGHHQSSKQRRLVIREQEGVSLCGLSAGLWCQRIVTQRRNKLARRTPRQWCSRKICPPQTAAGHRGGLAAGWDVDFRLLTSFRIVWKDPGLKTFSDFPGDRRYPLRKWLMTPVDCPESPAEFQYNLAHTATHEIVDRTFRAIQTRFKCLDGTKGYLQVFFSMLC